MKKKVFLSALILFAATVFAQTSEDLLKALKEKNVDAVRMVLEDSSEEDAPLFEELILEDSKKAVKKDDLDYAYKLAEVVLMYDFDNKTAQNLFTSIEKAKKSKAEMAAKEAEKERQRQEEAERQRQIEEFQAQKQKEQEAKEEHEKAVSTISKGNFPILIGLSPLSFDFTSSEIAAEKTGKKDVESKYGAGLFTNVGFVHPYLLANLHLNYNFQFFSFAGNGMKSDLETRFTVATPIISDVVRLSLGYNCINYINSNDTVVLTDINAGTLGVGIEDVKFGENFTLAAFVDFNTIAFMSDKINLAFDGDVTFRYDLPWSVFNKKLYAENNTVFNAFQISQKWEYSIATRFIVGVYLND